MVHQASIISEACLLLFHAMPNLKFKVSIVHHMLLLHFMDVACPSSHSFIIFNSSLFRFLPEKLHGYPPSYTEKLYHNISWGAMH